MMERQTLQLNLTDALVSFSQGAMPFSLSSGTETKWLSKYSWDLEFRHFKRGAAGPHPGKIGPAHGMEEGEGGYSHH